MRAREPSQLPPRVLYGYVRVVRDDKERAAALKADLMAFCQTYGFMLGTVFIDFGVEDSDVARPGFSSLIDVCKLVGSHGVLVPSRTHLSAHEETLTVLLRHIQQTGVELIAADEFERCYTNPHEGRPILTGETPRSSPSSSQPTALPDTSLRRSMNWLRTSRPRTSRGPVHCAPPSPGRAPGSTPLPSGDDRRAAASRLDTERPPRPAVGEAEAPIPPPRPH